MNNTKIKYRFAAMLLSGFFFRLISLNQSLWMDEAISANAASEFSYLGILRNFILSDTHPPFYYLLLKFWAETFGYSEVSLRFPSAIFGVLTIAVIYKIASKFSEKAAFYAGFLASVSPLLVYYSQEARMYALSTLLVSLLFLYLLEKRWLLFSITLFLLGITDYLPLSVMAAIWLYVLLTEELRNKLNFFISHVPVFIFYYFWMPSMNLQTRETISFVQKLPEFSQILGVSNIKNILLVWVKFLIGRINFSPSSLYILVVMVVSTPLLYSLKHAFQKKVVIFWLWLIVPILLSFLVSLNIPGFSYFRLIFTLPALIILMAYGLSRVNSGHRVFAIIYILQLLFTYTYLFNKNFWREDWKTAVPFLENRITDGEHVFVSYPESFTPYEWYSKKENLVVSFSKSSEFDTYTSLYSLDYLMDLTDPGGKNYQNLYDQGFKDSEVFNFRGVGQIRHWTRN